MIPTFDEHGLLPLGLHEATIPEIRSALGFTERRERLIDGLERFVRIWSESGFLEYSVIDGSFATAKPEPGDIDVLLVLNIDALSSRPADFRYLAVSHSYGRDFTKLEFGCEAFIVTGQDDLDGWLDFFGTDRLGRRRGLIRLEFPI